MRTTYVSEIHMPVDQLPMAKALVRRWAARRFDHDAVVVRRDHGQAGDLLEVIGEAPDGRDDTIVWHHSAWVFADSHDRVGVQVRSDVRARSIAVAGPVSYDAGDPGIVVDLVEHLDCRDGAVRLSVGTVPLVGDALLAHLRDRVRRLPVVVVRPGRGGRDPERIARLLVGIAVVVVAGDDTDTGLESTLPPGAARVYWAGWRDGLDRSHSTFHGASSPAQADPDLWVARSVIAAAAFRTPIPPIVADLEAEARLRRRAELVAVRERYEAEDVDALLAELEDQLVVNEKLQGELDGARREKAALVHQLRDADRRVEELAETLAWWERHAPSGGAADGDRGDRGALDVDVEVGSVANLADALSLADALDHVVVADAARFTFARPEAVARDLALLDDICARWEAGGLGASPHRAALEAGLGWRAGISQTALGKYGHVYTATVEGTQYELGPHLAYGAAGGSSDAVLRVYCALDREHHRVVVGRLMRHGPDSSNH